MSQSLGSSVGVVINDLAPSSQSAQQAQQSLAALASYGSLSSKITAEIGTVVNTPLEPAAQLQENAEKEFIEPVTTQSNDGRVVLVSLAAGALAGAVAKTTIAPLDRTKINFQTTNKRYSNRKAISFLVNSYKSDGFFNLWRGNSATMARIMPYAAVQFAAHEQWKRVLKLDNQGDHPPAKRVLAGSLAGVTSQFFTYPLDLARAQLAVTARDTYSSLGQVFTKIIQSEGLPALYRGITPTMLGVIPYAGTSFGIYESLKAQHRKKQRLEGVTEPLPPNSLERLAFGAMAGLVGQTASYPLDIARRRMQTAILRGNCPEYKTILGTLRKVYREEGLAHGLYKGVSMNFVKGPISVGISFALFEHLKSWLETLSSPSQ